MVAKLQVLEALRPGWGLDWANRSDAYGVSGIKWSSVCTRRGRVTLPYHRGDGLLYRAYGPSGSNNRR